MGYAPERKCTDKQILDFIANYHKKHCWGPSVREIAEAVGLQSTSTMQCHLLRLKREGKIVYKGVRQIRIVR